MSGKSIDDEFAELQKEIERVTTLAPASGTQDVAGIINALQGLKAHWEKRVAERFDQPVWRRRVDELIAVALQKLLQSGQTVDRQGNLGFHLDPETMKNVGKPVVNAALDGLEQAFIDKWVNAPKDQKKIEASDVGGILSLLLRNKINSPTKK